MRKVKLVLWDVLTPVLTLVAGLIAGFFAGVFYLRKQLEKMQNDPKMIQEMAKKMGYNVNKQQMQKMQKMLKNSKWK